MTRPTVRVTWPDGRSVVFVSVERFEVLNPDEIRNGAEPSMGDRAEAVLANGRRAVKAAMDAKRSKGRRFLDQLQANGEKAPTAHVPKVGDVAILRRCHWQKGWAYRDGLKVTVRAVGLSHGRVALDSVNALGEPVLDTAFRKGGTWFSNGFQLEWQKGNA